MDLVPDLDANGLLNMQLVQVAALANGSLSEGDHTITLNATDKFGNAAQPFVLLFKIKNTAPPVPSQPVLVLANGNTQGGGSIATKTLNIRVTDSAESIITLNRNDLSGPIQVGIMLARANVPVEFPVDLSLLADGSYTFTAKATDLVGNSSAGSQPLTLTIITRAPIVDSFALATDSIAPGSGSNTTGLPAVHLIGHTAPGASVTLLATGQITSADNGGNFSFTGVAVGFGTTTFTIQVADALGNTGMAQTTVIRPALSTTAPQVAATLQNDTGLDAADGITFDPTIVGAVQDVATVTNLFVTIDTQPTIDFTNALIGSMFKLSRALLGQAYGGPLLDGPHTIAIAAVDQYGNRSSLIDVTMTLVTAIPEAPPQPLLEAQSHTGRSPGDGLTNLTTVGIVLTAPLSSTVEISLDGNIVDNVPTDSTGIVTGTISGLLAGPHTVTAVTIDQAGNRSAASAPLHFTVDLTPPAAPNWTASASAPGAAMVTLVGTTSPLVDISLARGIQPDIAIASTRADGLGHFTLTGVAVAAGANTFIVTATSAAGNTSSASGDYFSNAPDTSPPQITLMLAHDTGGNHITNDPTVAGMVTAASRIVDFRVSINGSPFVGTLGALKNGRFSLNRSVLESILGQPLADGPVRVQVTATSASGYTAAPVELDFALVTVRPPTPEPLHPAPGTATLTGANQFITNATTLTLLTGLSVTTAQVVLYANGVAIARQSGAEPLSFAVNPAAGHVQYVVQAVDAAANVSFFTAPLDVTIDRTMPPVTAMLDLASANFTFGPGASTTQTVVTVDGTAKAGSTITLVGTPLFTKADGLGKYTLSGVAVRPGSNNLDIRSTDAAGNQADTTFTVTMHDITPPTVALSLVNDTGFNVNDRWTADPTTRAVVDDASPIALLQVSLNGGPFVDVLSHLVSDVLMLDAPLLQQTAGGPLPDGQLIIQVKAGDSAGNISPPAILSILFVRTPPSATVAPSLVSSSDTGASSFDNVTKLASPAIRLFAQRGALVTFYDGNLEVGHAFSAGVATIMPTALADGVHSITAAIEDQAGNVSARTPALTLTIYTTPPTTPTFGLDAAQQDPVRVNYTTTTQVTLHGQTTAATGEPPASVQLFVGTLDHPSFTTTVTAATGGNFTFSNVPLAVGDNTVTAVASDLAGNTSQFSMTITRGQLLPPLIVAQVTGGPTIRTPAVTGTVMAETSVVSFQAGFDHQPATQFINVFPDLHNGNFGFSADRLAQINGAPLSAGPHALHLVATDSRGLVSAVTNVSFTLDVSAQAFVTTSVILNVGSGLYVYGFALNGPTGSGWAIDQFALPVPATATISNLVTPAGWSIQSSGASGVVWRANADTAAVGPGSQLVFGLTSNDPPGGVDANLHAINAQGGLMVTETAHLYGPTAPNGPGVPDFYSTDADTPLSITAAAGVLANDLGSGLSVTGSDTISAWGVSIHVSSDGSFTYTPGNRFDGLSLGESVVDRFSYTVADGAGHAGQTVVEITIQGREHPPTATDVVPDLSQPSLFVRANTTTSIASAVVLASASDLGVNDTLSLATVAATSTLGASVQIVNGKIIYDPTRVAALQTLSAGTRVSDSFTYTVADLQGQTASASVHIIVQSSTDVPPLAGPGSIAITEDGKYDGSSLLKFGSDPDALPGDPPLMVVAGTVTSSAGATITVAADGTFAFDAKASRTIMALDPGQTLTDTFTYQVADFQHGIGTGTITLTVTGIKIPPTAVDYTFAISKTNILTVTAATGLLSQDSTSAAGDVLVVDPSQSDTLSAGGASILVRPDGSFQYDPTQAFPSLGAGQPYSDSFTYVIVDSFGSTARATIHINVTGVEDPPVAPDYDITAGFWAASGAAMTVDAAHGLLSKAYSPDTGVTSKLTAFGKGPSTLGATVIVHPDGSYTYDPTTSAEIQRLAAQGKDVIDTFSYGVNDPNGPVLDPTAEVVVKAGHPPYAYDLVASMQRDNFKSLGIGPSINDQGNVAFEGVDASYKDSPYIWTGPAGNGSTGITPFPVLNPGFLLEAPTADSSQPIYEQFGQFVQINNQDEILTQRVLSAGGIIGSLPGGIPVVTTAKFLLSYSEVYFGGNALAKSYPIPYQVAVGDSGISAAGIQWGNPFFRDIALAGLAGALGFTSIAGNAATTEAFTNLMLLPRAWIGGPIWGSLFLSPVDQNWTPVFWNTSNQGVVAAANAASDLALALSLGPTAIQTRLKDVDDFAAIFPSLSLSNGPPVPSAPGDYYSFNPGYIAFAGLGSTKNNVTNYLVTANHGGPRLLGEPAVFVPQPKVGDDGTTIVSNGYALHIFNFDLSTDNPIQDFAYVGQQPAISDGRQPWVAFAAHSAKLGDGIYAAEVSNPSQWYKIVGVSNDGHLDPNEKWVDANHDGKYEPGEDLSPLQSLDLDGPIGISQNDQGELTVSYFANVVQPNGNTQYSLQTAFFIPPNSPQAPLGPLESVDPANSDRRILPRVDNWGSSSVVSVGDIVPGAGTVQRIATFDAINSQGQVVFWTQTDRGQAILRANPILPQIKVEQVTTDDSKNVKVKYNVRHNANDTPFTLRIYRAYHKEYEQDRAQQVLVAEILLTPNQSADGDHEIVVGPEGQYGFSLNDPLRPDPTHEYVIATADDDGSLNANDALHVPQQEFRIWVVADVTHGFNESGFFSDPGNPFPLPPNKLTLILFDSALFPTSEAGWLNPMVATLNNTQFSGYDAAIAHHWEDTSATNFPAPGQFWTRSSGKKMGQDLIANMPGKLSGFDPSKDVVDVHFIGHSRGGVVISEALMDINDSNVYDASYNIPNIPHWLSAGYQMMTMLDPHPANNQIWPDLSDPKGTHYGALSDSFDDFLANAEKVVFQQFLTDYGLHLASGSSPADAVVQAIADVGASNVTDNVKGAIEGYFIVGPARSFQSKAQDDNVVIPSNVRKAQEYYQNSTTANSFSDPFESFVNLWGENPDYINNQSGVELQRNNMTTVDTKNKTGIGHGEIPINLYAGFVNGGGRIAFIDPETGQTALFPYTLSLMGLEPFIPSVDPLFVTAQPPTTVTAGTSFSLTVTAEYDNGVVNKAFNDPITLTLDSKNAAATLGGTRTVTAVHGVATFSDLTVNESGSDFQIIASTATLPNVLTNSFDVTPTVSVPVLATVAVVAPQPLVAPVVRTPSDAEVNHVVEALQSGAAPEVIAAAFATSAEHESIRMRDDYFRFLGRDAGQEEMDNRLQGLKSGESNENLVADLLASAEYYDSAIKGKSDRFDWLTSAALDVLDRALSMDELKSWEAKL